MVRLFKRSEEENAPEVSGERKDALLQFQKIAGIKFRNLELLNLAFSHRSFANEQHGYVGNNERLEFLGDSVLGLAVAEFLYANLPDRAEGDLAKIKSFVVSEASLSVVARRLHVDSYVLIGKGEEYSGGRAKRAILADAMEAIIGAHFLDSGFKESKKFILSQMVPEIDKVLQDKHQKDYKTLLQEYSQKTFRTYPKYILSKKTGPDHERVFWMDVEVAGDRFGPGSGSNKKQAEQAAAQIAYDNLIERGSDAKGRGKSPRGKKQQKRSS